MPVGPLRFLGKKHIEIASQWIGSGAMFGGASGAAVLYFTDWKVVLQYLPFYNGKFVKDE